MPAISSNTAMNNQKFMPVTTKSEVAKSLAKNITSVMESIKNTPTKFYLRPVNFIQMHKISNEIKEISINVDNNKSLSSLLVRANNLREKVSTLQSNIKNDTNTQEAFQFIQHRINDLSTHIQDKLSTETIAQKTQIKTINPTVQYDNQKINTAINNIVDNIVDNINYFISAVDPKQIHHPKKYKTLDTLTQTIIRDTSAGKSFRTLGPTLAKLSETSREVFYARYDTAKPITRNDAQRNVDINLRHLFSLLEKPIVS